MSGSAEQIQEEAGLNHRSREEIDEVSEALIEACKSCVSLGKPVDVAGANNVTNCALPSTSLELKQSSVGVPPKLGDPNKVPLDQHLPETLKPNSKSLPAVLVRVMESKLCKERIQRSAQRYDGLIDPSHRSCSFVCNLMGYARKWFSVHNPLTIALTISYMVCIRRSIDFCNVDSAQG